MDGYEIMPFAPEPLDSMKGRFAAALCQIPNPPTRQHTFDFDINVRMIASVEYAPRPNPFDHERFIHLSFGIPPWNKLIRTPAIMQRVAREMSVIFVGLKEPVETMQTNKAFHLFYKA